VLEEVELLGRTGYFTELRVDKETCSGQAFL